MLIFPLQLLSDYWTKRRCEGIPTEWGLTEQDNWKIPKAPVWTCSEYQGTVWSHIDAKTWFIFVQRVCQVRLVNCSEADVKSWMLSLVTFFKLCPHVPNNHLLVHFSVVTTSVRWMASISQYWTVYIMFFSSHRMSHYQTLISKVFLLQLPLRTEWYSGSSTSTTTTSKMSLCLLNVRNCQVNAKNASYQQVWILSQIALVIQGSLNV